MCLEKVTNRATLYRMAVDIATPENGGIMDVTCPRKHPHLEQDSLRVIIMAFEPWKERQMKVKKFTDEQKIGILKELDAGIPVRDLCRKYGVSNASIYLWKRKLGGMDVQDAKRLRFTEDENRKLKRLVADLTLEVVALKDIVSGKI